MMKTFAILAFVLIALSCLTEAFVPKFSLPKKSVVTLASKCKPFTRHGIVRFMSEEVENYTPPATDDDGRKLTFNNNLRSRKGRTTDEDGKSNIWAFESKEEVEVTRSSGYIVLGVVLALFLGALTLLPQIEFPSYD